MVFIDQMIGHRGRWLIQQFKYLSELFLMVYVSLRSTIQNQAHGLRTIFSVVMSQIYFTGFQALPLMSVLALATGSVVIMQSSQLSVVGGVSMIGQVLVAFVVREVGPLLTALVVVARSGTAVASEIGNMRANREIEALESMGINPLSFIVFPRLVGGVISVLCLSFYFIVIALIGGFLITKVIHDMSMSFYINLLFNSFTANDGILFLIKNSFSGLIIFSVSCFQGLSVKKSPTEVPAATTVAVVKSILYVVLFNASVTFLFYLKKILEFS